MVLEMFQVSKNGRKVSLRKPDSVRGADKAPLTAMNLVVEHRNWHRRFRKGAAVGNTKPGS